MGAKVYFEMYDVRFEVCELRMEGEGGGCFLSNTQEKCKNICKLVEKSVSLQRF